MSTTLVHLLPTGRNKHAPKVTVDTALHLTASIVVAEIRPDWNDFKPYFQTHWVHHRRCSRTTASLSSITQCVCLYLCRTKFIERAEQELGHVQEADALFQNARRLPRNTKDKTTGPALHQGGGCETVTKPVPRV